MWNVLFQASGRILFYNFWPYLWFQEVIGLRAGSGNGQDMVLSPALLNPPSLPKPITPAPQLPRLPPASADEFR